MSYALVVKGRHFYSSANDNKTDYYLNKPTNKPRSNNNSHRQHSTIPQSQTPLSSIQDIVNSIRPISSTNKNNNSLFQPKLRISQPGDVYEQEADRIAEKVMGSSISSDPFFLSPEVQPIGSNKTSIAEGKQIDKKNCSACQTKEQEKKIEINGKPSHASNLESSDQVSNETMKNVLSGRSNGAPLDASTQNFMSIKFGHDFSKVRIHTDSRAAESANSINAAAYTVGNDIVFARGQYSPNSAGGKRLLAHELTHVVQQSGLNRRSRADFADSRHGASISQPGRAHSANMGVTAGLIQRAPKTTLEANTSESERGNLQVPIIKKKATLSQTEIDAIMNDKAPTRLAGVEDVKFSPEITAQIRLGLEALAAELFEKEIGLDPQSVTYVKLDLSKFGGVNGVYRFTLIERKANPKRRIIIEQISASPPVGSDKIDPVAEDKRIAKFGLQLGSGFTSDDKRKQLLGVLARVKDPILEHIRGVTFVLDSGATGEKDEAGHYDPNTHTVIIYESAFSTSLNSSDPGSGDYFTHVVMHEIGHAVDYEPYVQAKIKVDDLEKAVKDVERAKRVTVNPTDAPIMNDKALMKKQKEKEKKIQALNKDYEKAFKEFQKISSEAELGDKRPSEEGAVLTHSKEFKKASGKAISDRGKRGAGENFAELAAMFIVDPELLRSLRPRAFKYFSEKFK